MSFHHAIKLLIQILLWLCTLFKIYILDWANIITLGGGGGNFRPVLFTDDPDPL